MLFLDFRNHINNFNHQSNFLKITPVAFRKNVDPIYVASVVCIFNYFRKAFYGTDKFAQLDVPDMASTYRFKPIEQDFYGHLVVSFDDPNKIKCWFTNPVYIQKLFIIQPAFDV